MLLVPPDLADAGWTALDTKKAGKSLVSGLSSLGRTV
jgi:hypothetical protein